MGLLGIASASAMTFAAPLAALETLRQRVGTEAEQAALAFSIVPLTGIVFLIVAAMISDRRRRGRVHRVYWVGGGALLALYVLRVPSSATDAWRSFAGWFASLGT